MNTQSTTEVRARPPLRLYEPPRGETFAPRIAWRAGDLVEFFGREWQSRTIEVFTRGPSHIGIIIFIHGQPRLLESTTLCDLACEVQQRKVQGVQVHTPEKRISRYNGRVSRLPIEAPLWPDEVNHLTRVAIEEFVGKPYDMEGAIGSGPRLLKLTRFLPYPDLGSIFCSALCAHLLMRINRLNWANPKRYNPADLVRAVRRNATHGAPQPLPRSFAHQLFSEE